MKVGKGLRIATLIILATAGTRRASAEADQIRAAQQYGLSYLALMLMEDGKLVEKHAKAAGLPEPKVTWAKLGGPGAMNDALLSGGLDFGTGGVPSLITLWAKTTGTPMEVRGVGALNDMPNELITSNPKVKTLKDFGPGAHRPGHAGDLLREDRQRLGHVVERLAQRGDLAFRVHLQGLAQVAVRHRGDHLHDAAHLGGQVRGHEVHVVGQVLPHARH